MPELQERQTHGTQIPSLPDEEAIQEVVAGVVEKLNEIMGNIFTYTATVRTILYYYISSSVAKNMTPCINVLLIYLHQIPKYTSV